MPRATLQALGLFLLISCAGIDVGAPETMEQQTMQLSDLSPGDIVMLDNGFPCRTAGPARVFYDPDGGFFVACQDGRHYLDGQEDEAGDLVGLAPPPVDFDPAAYLAAGGAL